MMLISVAEDERLWLLSETQIQGIGLKTETRFEKGRVFFGFYDTAHLRRVWYCVTPFNPILVTKKLLSAFWNVRYLK